MNDDLHRLTGAYAADALSAEERAAFERHLQECQACTQEVSELRATTAKLGVAAAEPPPAHLRDRVLAAATQTRQLPPQPGRARAVGLRRWPTRALAAAAALLLVVAVGLGVQIRELDQRLDTAERQAAQVTSVLTAPDVQVHRAESAAASVVASPAQGRAVFVASGLPAVPSSRVYQLWMIDDGGPRSAGLFTLDGGHVSQLMSGQLQGVTAVAVTVEPSGGSPQPTSELMLSIPLST